MCEFDGAFFFGGEGEVFCLPAYYRFCIDARGFSREEGGNDDAGRVPVEKRDAPTLIASGILERIESDNANFVYANESERLDFLGNGEELLDLRVECTDFLIMTHDNGFQVGTALSFEEHFLTLVELTRLAKELHYQENLHQAEKSHTGDSG